MYEQFRVRNENLFRQEKNRALDKAADIIMGTKEVVRTGFEAFDHLGGGFGRGELVLLGARPGIGKTAMALQMAEYNAVRYHIPVFYISLQKSTCSVMKRLLHLMTGIDDDEDLIDDEANDLFQRAYTKIKEAQLYVRYCDNPTMLHIAHEMSFCSDIPKLVIVDEIGVPYMSKKESLRIVKEMRKLAEATDATVLILSNTSCLVDERKDHMPVLADFPVPVRMADAVIRMYREDYYNPEPSYEAYDPTHFFYEDWNGCFGERINMNYDFVAGRFVHVESSRELK